MTKQEIAEADIIFQSIIKLLNAFQKVQILGNTELHVRAHEWPGVKTNAITTKTGYGFNLYCDYFLKGNAGKRYVIMDKEFNSSRPGETCFDHINYHDYLNALLYIINYLDKHFDINKIMPLWKQGFAQIIQGLKQ
jgi:hypothetical protein